MNVLVTGGGGFLGRYIVEQLAARGDCVRTYSRGEYPELKALGVDQHRGDLLDRGALQAACAGQECVIHAAALPGIWGRWRRFYETNTLGTENVIAACRAAGVGKLVYTSSPSVVYDGRPHENADESLPYPARHLCHYSRSKALAEQQVLAANGTGGLLTVALRPHLIWGPRDPHLIPRLIERAKTGRLRRVGDGRNRVSITYVENAAAAHVQAADALRPGSPAVGRAYFINDEQPVVLWDWINEVLCRAGLSPVTRGVPYPVAWLAGAMLEAAWSVLRLRGEPLMTRFLASQLSQSHSYRIAAAVRDFGYRPIVSPEEGMRQLEPELRSQATSR